MKKLILISALLFSFNGWANECTDGDCVNGSGTLVFESGLKYTGQFRARKRNGFGTLTWPSGQEYVGEWKNGEYHGQGTLTWAAGKYIGEWKNGKYHGQGTLTSGGTTKKGPFEDGKFIGASLIKVDNFDGAVVCFNSDTKIYDIDDIYISRTRLNSGSTRYIKYETKNFFGEVREHEIVWNPQTSTSCNITYNTKRDVCVTDGGKETDMTICEE